LRTYSYAEVAQRCDVRALAQEMGRAYRTGVCARMVVPQRETVSLPAPPSAFLSMPAVSADLGLYVNKVATIFARPPGDARPTVTAVVLVFSAQTGDLVAALDGNALTSVKCAAVTALVTDACAEPRAAVLAIVGSGVQARQQYAGVTAVRDITEVRVHARSAEHRRRFADELRAQAQGARRIVEVDSLEAAIDGADVVGTATAANRPLGAFAHLAPHAHVNCMGGHTTESRELPLELLRSTQLIVEHVPTAVAEAGSVHDQAADIAAMLAMDPARLRERRTIFSSTGHAALDVVAAAHVLARAA
jgi:ornithine cyclodeaminase/alanine dehydrogenase-like protein (mu-crystallin family)